VLLDRSDRVPPAGRPWVMANMVTSIDGAYAVSGVSGTLSSPEDREVFHVLRAASDVVLVAAGTARTERYRRPTTTAELLPARRAAGLADVPRLAVVSRSLHLPADQPFLQGDGPEPLLLHPAASDTSSVPDGVQLRAVGDEDVDLPAALRSLRADGAQVVLCEGGPRLLGQLHALDLIDELFLTVAPVLSGGPHVGILGGADELAVPQRLHRVWEADGFLFLTYRAARD
jgi:riboflavin biosynthesis pyrimidine reductase